MAGWKAFDPGAGALGQIIDPARTAVLIIDVQNDFGDPKGVMGLTGADFSRVDPAVDAAGRLAAAARAAGAPVIFIALETSAQRDSRPATLRRERLGMPYAEDTRVCRKDTWGADWYRIAPEPGDILLAKWRYSSFQDTELDLQLKALGVDTIIACGLTTECCVETAVRDAFHRDYHCFVAEDACASYDTALHDVSVRTMAIFHALIVSVDSVADAWAAQ